MPVRPLGSRWDIVAAQAHAQVSNEHDAISLIDHTTRTAGFAVYTIGQDDIRDAYGPSFDQSTWDTVRRSQTWKRQLWFPHSQFVQALDTELRTRPAARESDGSVAGTDVEDGAYLTVEEMSERFSLTTVIIDADSVYSMTGIHLEPATAAATFRSSTFRSFTWFDRSHVLSALRSTMTVDPTWPG